VVRRSELISLSYFVYLFVPILRARISRGARARVLAWAAATVVAIVAVTAFQSTAQEPIRDWAPCLWLVAGYWLPGRLFTAPDVRLEQALLAIDARILPAARRMFSTVSPALMEGLELAYLLCYPLVPAAFAVVYFAGHGDTGDRADRFWSAVLPAVYVCYGLLPWLPTRPPRALVKEVEEEEQKGGEYGPIRRLNLFVLKHTSIQVNTFPSGHVAASLASALALSRVLPLQGAVFGLIACAIAVGSVAGRYHYAADAILGALIALVAFAIVR